MLRRRPSLAICLIVSLAALSGGATAFAEEPPWELFRKTSDGIAIYMREMPGSTVRAAMATCTVAAPPEIVLDAAADPDTFRASTKYVTNNRLQYTAEPSVWYIYQVLSYPVVDPRDYALRYELRADRDKRTYRLSWKTTTAYGPPPQKGVVRVTLAEGYIDVRPLPGGREVAVTYYLVADPGGSIPGWVMRIAQRFNLPAIMRELRDEAQRRAAAKQPK
jgi:hypothetical protein